MQSYYQEFKAGEIKQFRHNSLGANFLIDDLTDIPLNQLQLIWGNMKRFFYFLANLFDFSRDYATEKSDNSFTIIIQNISSYDIGSVQFAAWKMENCQNFIDGSGGNIKRGETGKVSMCRDASVRQAKRWCIQAYSSNYTDDNIAWYGFDILWLENGKVHPRVLTLTDGGWFV